MDYSHPTIFSQQQMPCRAKLLPPSNNSFELRNKKTDKELNYFCCLCPRCQVLLCAANTFACSFHTVLVFFRANESNCVGARRPACLLCFQHFQKYFPVENKSLRLRHILPDSNR